VSSSPIPAGKLPADLLNRLLRELPPPPAEVRLGPRLGEDACALDLPAGVLVAATDPITLTGEEVGRLAVVVNANDVAVSGARPRWFLATVLLPLGTTDQKVGELFRTMQATLDEIGATLVGGHTEVTAAVSQPVVVGQMLGLTDERGLVRTAGAGPGDVLVQVGMAPVEAAAVLGAADSDRLATLSEATVASAMAAAADPGVSVVDAALVAANLGATAMHDPTEGGLASGLNELADAAGVALRVDRSKVLWFEPGLAVCEVWGADPWAALASGALLATFDPADAEEAVRQLSARSYPTAVIGSVEPGTGVWDLHDELIRLPDRDEVARVLA
jgi:hydrogenase maturation factor